MKITIPDDYQDCVRRLDCFDLLEGHEVRIYNDNVKGTDALAARFADAEVIVLTRERTIIDDALLQRLPQLKLICQTGRVGANVDVEACTRHGVLVMDGAGDSSSTAELTWALILASRRHLIDEVLRLRGGQWQGYVGQQLRGQQLGIWGYGRIGKQVAGYGRAFGMNVWVWGREGSAQRARTDGYEVAPSRQAFFANSDVVSVHVRLNDATRGLVTASDLALMKGSALFVNTSRAELVQPGALEHALKLGAPGFAAVDVYEEEPVLGGDHPLLALPNALCTPHIGFVERDNYENYYRHAFENIRRYAAGDHTGAVNPQALDAK